MSGVNASTATATTATADSPAPGHTGRQPPGGDADSSRTGRFAPSPTGPLHIGSVLAALGSWLDARQRGGRWLLRIEDLDTPRVIPEAAGTMLRTLDALGLEWDGVVEYQSRNQDRYRAALQTLKDSGRVFECSCSRRELAGADTGYPGTCRDGPVRPGPTAVRLRLDPGELCFDDRVQGRCSYRLEQLGDVVIRRRDGLFAYQLAVVVDDAHQGVTDVVRGADLLDSTPWQMQLQRALGLPQPRYAHLPVVVDPGGAKLAKSRHAVPADTTRPGAVLLQALKLLRQRPPAELAGLPPAQVLAWAVPNWNPSAIQGLASIPCDVATA